MSSRTRVVVLEDENIDVMASLFEMGRDELFLMKEAAKDRGKYVLIHLDLQTPSILAVSTEFNKEPT